MTRSTDSRERRSIGRHVATAALVLLAVSGWARQVPAADPHLSGAAASVRTGAGGLAAPTSACNRPVRDEQIPQALRLSAPVARHSSTDYALATRHHRLKIRRFRRSFGGLPSGAAQRNELLVAGIVGTVRIAKLHLSASSRDHARAPPSSNHPA